MQLMASTLTRNIPHKVNKHQSNHSILSISESPASTIAIVEHLYSLPQAVPNLIRYKCSQDKLSSEHTS